MARIERTMNIGEEGKAPNNIGEHIDQARARNGVPLHNSNPSELTLLNLGLRRSRERNMDFEMIVWNMALKMWP